MDPRVREDDGAAGSDSVDFFATRKVVIPAQAGIQFLRAVLAPIVGGVARKLTLPPPFDLKQYRSLPSDLA
jgi:hypothetical protein